MNFDSFVECNIVSVSIVEVETRTNVLIVIEDHEKKCWLLNALSVSDFLLNEMRLQNIIDQITLLDKEWTGDQSGHNKIYYLLRGNFPNGKDSLECEDVRRAVEDIKCSNKIFLEVEPVYGASLLLMAKKISLSPYPY